MSVPRDRFRPTELRPACAAPREQKPALTGAGAAATGGATSMLGAACRAPACEAGGDPGGVPFTLASRCELPTADFARCNDDLAGSPEGRWASRVSGCAGGVGAAVASRPWIEPRAIIQRLPRCPQVAIVSARRLVDRAERAVPLNSFHSSAEALCWDEMLLGSINHDQPAIASRRGKTAVQFRTSKSGDPGAHVPGGRFTAANEARNPFGLVHAVSQQNARSLACNVKEKSLGRSRPDSGCANVSPQLPESSMVSLVHRE